MRTAWAPSNTKKPGGPKVRVRTAHGVDDVPRNGVRIFVSDSASHPAQTLKGEIVKRLQSEKSKSNKSGIKLKCEMRDEGNDEESFRARKKM